MLFFSTMQGQEYQTQEANPSLSAPTSEAQPAEAPVAITPAAVPADRLPVLVVDDDRMTRELLRATLEHEGFAVTVANSGEQARELARQDSFAIVLSDIHMLEMDGLGLLKHLKETHSNAVMILMTSYGSLQSAVEAIREGAFDYLSKPLKADELKALMNRAAHQWKARHQHRETAPMEIVKGSIIGRAPSMVSVYKTIAKAALGSSNVLIVGESGTGKELVARAVHDHSNRRLKPFVTVNCGALTETLLESELFGHIKGSFTGAISNKRGLFDEAHEGTIFLDEIGDITPALQVKLLRVIQEGEFKPVGSTEIRKVDARVIAATHRDLDQLVREGKFREDLYYRLKVIWVELPPLRKRVEDIPELVRYFLSKSQRKVKGQVPQIRPDAMDMLCRYTWPGNIRELEHAVERAVAMTNSNLLYIDDFPPEISHYRPTEPGMESTSPRVAPPEEVPQSLEQMEKTHIVRILQQVRFNKSRAAEILGIDRATLYRKAQRYGISLAEDRL